MKNDAHIDHLFKELKESRPELDIKDIQEMVVVFPDAPPPFDWGQLFNLNNIIMFALTSSLIAGTIYLFSGSAEAQSNLEQNTYYLTAQDSITEHVDQQAPTNTIAPVSEVPSDPQAALNEPESSPPSDDLAMLPPLDPNVPEAEQHLDIQPVQPLQPTVSVREYVLSKEPFHSVELYGSPDVFIQPGESHKVWAEGDAEYAELVDVTVTEGVMKITIEDKDWSWRKWGDKELDIYVTTPELNAVRLFGSGDIEVGGFKDLDEFDISLNGSGDIRFTDDIKSLHMSIQLAGSGDIEVQGSASSVHVSLAGSGDVQAHELQVHDAVVSVAGSGDVSIHADGEVRASIVGSGDVAIHGKPSHVHKNVSGSGDVTEH